MSQMDLQALYLSGTYRHNTGTRPSSYAKPLQPTLYVCYLLQDLEVPGSNLDKA